MARKTKKKSLISTLSNLDMVDVQPLTENQERAFTEYDYDKNLVLHGHAGTGKTYLALFLALRELSEDQNYDKLIIIRSVVPSREIGFLPGSLEDKIEVYEEPYEEMCGKIFRRGDAYSTLKKSSIIDFKTTSFMRGITYDRSIVIIDECQNMIDQEISTILTRIGEDTRFILCGDFRQNDLGREKSGLNKNINILKNIDSVSFINFTVDDIVRSGFVRDYIKEREEYEKDNQ